LSIDKGRRHKPNDALTGVEGDFLEKYSAAQVQFCLHTFEIISTSIMLVEFYTKENSALFHEIKESNLWAIITLFFYGVVTAVQTF
jgi:hypothetical protein